MSRIGRKPITVPAGTTVTLGENNLVTVKGSKGTLAQSISPRMTIAIKGNVITVSRSSDEKEDRSLHGLSRTLIQNMVIGVTEGYSKTLEIVGVSYKASKQGKRLTLNLGYSHPIYMDEENGITYDVPNPNTIIVKGIDKQVVGQTAAVIRGKRPPEPYHGKGVKYANEKIRRKTIRSGK